MAVEFNRFGKYNNYNLLIGQEAAKKAQESQKEEVKKLKHKHRHSRVWKMKQIY